MDAKTNELFEMAYERGMELVAKALSRGYVVKELPGIPDRIADHKHVGYAFEINFPYVRIVHGLKEVGSCLKCWDIAVMHILEIFGSWEKKGFKT